jgi:D-proline reductase (dithiol) PrdB
MSPRQQRRSNHSKYVDPITQRVVEAWMQREPSREPVFSRPPRELARCRVALLSTAGLALNDDRGFDQAGEERDPWWGDPSHRVIPQGTTTGDVRSHHLHIGREPLDQDLNCVLPLDRLEEMASADVVGQVADSHYSIMGYLLDTTALQQQTVPLIVDRLRREEVDVVLLVPV